MLLFVGRTLCPLGRRFTRPRRVRPRGSIAGAAGRLFRTPSAITRQVQRLEAALGAELLDRSVKPPRLNSLGSRVLEQARDLLQRTETLKSLTSSDAEPHGLPRVGDESWVCRNCALVCLGSGLASAASD
jgi:DNA-binding transcriptional LysR family regulator